MRAAKLLVQLTIYYLVIGLAIFIAVKMWPDLRGYLPVGGVEQLITQPAKNPLAGERSDPRRACRQPRPEPVLAGGRDHRRADLPRCRSAGSTCRCAAATNMTSRWSTRSSILPMVVTGIVIIVQNSLALAFASRGLPGRCGSATRSRARATPCSSCSRSAIGLSAGIGAVELAAVISIALNYTFAFLWLTEYGEREGMKRFLADYDGTDHAAPPVPEKKKA